MRWLFKLTIKLTVMGVILALLGIGLIYARPYIMKAAGIPVVEGAPGIEDVSFSSEESDLMGTILKSAMELFSGKRSRNELANELSDKLYDGRMDAPGMKELGIELDKKPESGPSASKSATGSPATGSSNARANGSAASRQASGATGRPMQAGGKRPEPISKNGRAALVQLWAKGKLYVVAIALVFLALLVLLMVLRRRRRRAQLESFIPATPAINDPLDADLTEMKHAVHSLKAEEFEMLIALIYQRQGYRVSLPAGLGGERGINFTIARKAERILVQCRRLSLEQKIPVERVRELHEAVAAAGATRGLLVASCGFTWDARHFAKAKGVTLVNARKLDTLLDAIRENPDEDLLNVAQWAPKFLGKAELTPPTCPACEAKMDQVSGSDNSVWVCSQRPDCRGRRGGRNYQKPARATAQKTETQTAEVST